MSVTLTPGPVAAAGRVRPATLSIPTPVASRATGPITVATILDNLFRQVGLTADQYDLTAATDVVDGFYINNRAAVSEIISVLLRVYQVDLVEIDEQLVARKRGDAAVADLTDADIGAYLWGGQGQPDPKVRAKKVQPLELPAEGDITYLSFEKDYDEATQRATRSTIDFVDDQLTINTPLVLSDDFARQTIERLLYELWVNRDTFSLVLTPKWMYLCPGDCLNIPHAGQTRRVRIISMDVALFGPIPVEAVLDEVGILTQTATGGITPANSPSPAVVTDTTLKIWCGNALRDADTTTVGVYAVAGGATAGDWPGCVLYLSRDDGATYQPVAEITDPGSFGVTTSVLAAPNPAQTALWDRVSTVDFTLQSGTAPVSVSEAEVLNGANTVRIGEEVLQYQTVTALGGNAYRLSNLLRGQRGTDYAWSSHASGEDVIFLDSGGSTVRVELDEGLVNKPIKFKAVTLGRTLADATAVDLTLCGDEWKCYAPCLALLCRCSGPDDIEIDWTRRTRSGGVWADYVDVDQPEAGNFTVYSVDIYNGPTVVRTLDGLGESAVYAAADQITDFGSLQTSVHVAIYQIGRYGRGYPLDVTLSF